MSYSMHGQVDFPLFTGARCYMMPVIQGRGESLPDRLAHYAGMIERLAIDPGEIGFLTIDESMVVAGASQRGYGSGDRAIHTEACLSETGASWGPSRPTWGRVSNVMLDPDLRALIANSIDETCMIWDAEVRDTTPDGDLSARVTEFPRHSGRMMKSGEVVNIGIWTPHECIPQRAAGPRQFIRIVGSGVHGRDPGFDRNDRIGTAS